MVELMKNDKTMMQWLQISLKGNCLFASHLLPSAMQMFGLQPRFRCQISMGSCLERRPERSIHQTFSAQMRLRNFLRWGIILDRISPDLRSHTLRPQASQTWLCFVIVHFAFGHAGMYAIDWKRPGVSRRQLRAALSLAQSSGVWSRIWSFFGPVNYPPTTRGKGVAGGLGEPYFDGNVPGIDYLGAKKELQDMWKVILPIDFHIFQRGWNHQPVYVYVVMAKRNGILLLQKNSWDWSIYF